MNSTAPTTITARIPAESEDAPLYVVGLAAWVDAAVAAGHYVPDYGHSLDDFTFDAAVDEEKTMGVAGVDGRWYVVEHAEGLVTARLLEFQERCQVCRRYEVALRDAGGKCDHYTCSTACTERLELLDGYADTMCEVCQVRLADVEEFDEGEPHRCVSPARPDGALVCSNACVAEHYRILNNELDEAGIEPQLR